MSLQRSKDDEVDSGVNTPPRTRLGSTVPSGKGPSEEPQHRGPLTGNERRGTGVNRTVVAPTCVAPPRHVPETGPVRGRLSVVTVLEVPGSLVPSHTCSAGGVEVGSGSVTPMHRDWACRSLCRERRVTRVVRGPFPSPSTTLSHWGHRLGPKFESRQTGDGHPRTCPSSSPP